MPLPRLMPSEDLADPASFRDPSGHVYQIDGQVFRTVTEQAVAEFEFVRASGLYDDLVAAGEAISADIVEKDFPESLDVGACYVLEHPRLPIISYPYEWSFAALKAAALLHLDIHLKALERGITLSDASAYNIQFIGAKPIFIDTLSFRQYREGAFWAGHKQFCEQFLNPLLLRAIFGTPHNPWYRGALDGIPTAELTRLLPLHRKLSWNVLSQLVLPTAFDRSAQQGKIDVRSRALQRSRFPRAAFERLLRRLRKWIAGLQPRDTAPTAWQNYSAANTYGRDAAEAKRNFVQRFIAAEKPAMVWDFGCNTGDYAEAALTAGAGYVVGWDFDQGALDAAFARASERSLAFTPLFFDAVNPAPDQGWAQQERRGMRGRGPADAVLALAFVHHLAIARNLPLPKVARWLTGVARTGVVEFVPKDDPMVQTMLHLREDIFPDYGLEHFLECLGTAARIERVEPIGRRRLVWFRTAG
ncbi:MAG: class I SAM-dependent methyltransferase [Kiloniellaceae bacterium]